MKSFEIEQNNMKILKVIQGINNTHGKLSLNSLQKKHKSRPRSNMSYQMRQREKEMQQENKRLYTKIIEQKLAVSNYPYKNHVKLHDTVSFNLS